MKIAFYEICSIPLIFLTKSSESLMYEQLCCISALRLFYFCGGPQLEIAGQVGARCSILCTLGEKYKFPKLHALFLSTSKVAKLFS